MCGICGLISLHADDRVDETELRGMMDTMVHRGPDDSGLRIDGRVGLGHRRLSIIDLSSAGRQPMCNEDRSVWITYNGEFYNFKDYVPELKREGHLFQSKTDTEVIIHLYEQYGLAETLRRINGMFAFCLWDKKRNKQYLVRDRFGIKPLYYYRGKGRVGFASETKAFYGLKDFRPRLREDRFAELYLFSRPHDQATRLEDVFAVRPGTYIEIDGEAFREHVYYDLSGVQERKNITEEEALEEFDQLLTQSVQRRLVSDVPVGIFLSGGLDSTILALKAAELVDGPITTISVAYPEASANEFFWSDQVADKIRSNHFKIQVDAKNFFELHPWLTYIYDAPIGTGAAFYEASRVAKEKCTVMICGQGSDELFSGYSKYIYARFQKELNQTLRYFMPSSILEELSRVLPRCGHHKMFRKVAARLALKDGEVAASYSGSIAREDYCSMLANMDHQGYLDMLGIYAARFPDELNTDFLNKMLHAEIHQGLQGILQQTDRMTMAASVETRVPFLDHEMVEFAFSLPSSLKLKGRDGKYLLKKYLLKHFPPEFIYRKKMGFPTPMYEWFMDSTNPIHLVLQDDDDGVISRQFDQRSIDEFVRRVRDGKLGHTSDVLGPLLAFISLKVWWKTVTAPPPSPPYTLRAMPLTMGTRE